jgi:hypothetical protein
LDHGRIASLGCGDEQLWSSLRTLKVTYPLFVTVHQADVMHPFLMA